MNWEAAGAIGEIVGAFAVVATLIYFALQLKQAIRANEAQGTVVSSELFSKWRTTLLENTDLAVTLSKANNDIELSDAEKTQLYALADELFTAAAVSYAISQHTGATYEQAGEIRYTMSVLESNPGLIPEWIRIRPMVEMVSSDYAIGIDKQINGDNA